MSGSSSSLDRQSEDFVNEGSIPLSDDEASLVGGADAGHTGDVPAGQFQSENPLILHPLHRFLHPGRELTHLVWPLLQTVTGLNQDEFQASADVEAQGLQYSSLAAEAARVAATAEISRRLVPTAYEYGPRTHFGTHSWYLEVPSTTGLKKQVRVVLSEVSYAVSKSGIVLAIVTCPRHLPGSPGVRRWKRVLQAEHPRVPLVQSIDGVGVSEREIWLFLYDGGLHGLFELLDRFGSSGAIRTDMQSSVSVENDLLGEGFSANVFSAQNLRAAGGSDQIACKAMKGDGGRSEDVVAHEIDLLSQVQGHSNICKLLNTFMWARASSDDEDEDGGGAESSKAGIPSTTWVITMELYKGDLHQRLSSAPLSQEACRHTSFQLLSALDHVHSRNIVHRDVKPQNILLSKGAFPILADFGVAAFQNDKAAAEKCSGTPGFVAPELLKANKLSGKADVFSYGATLYFMLCRQPAFQSINARSLLILNSTCEVPEDVLVASAGENSISTEFVLTLMQKDVKARPTALAAMHHKWFQPPGSSESGGEHPGRLRGRSSSSHQLGGSHGSQEPVSPRSPKSPKSLAQGSAARWMKKPKNPSADQGEDEVSGSSSIREPDTLVLGGPIRELVDGFDPKPIRRPHGRGRSPRPEGQISGASPRDSLPGHGEHSFNGQGVGPCVFKDEDGRKLYRVFGDSMFGESGEGNRSGWLTWRSARSISPSSSSRSRGNSSSRSRGSSGSRGRGGRVESSAPKRTITTNTRSSPNALSAGAGTASASSSPSSAPRGGRGRGRTFTRGGRSGDASSSSSSRYQLEMLESHRPSLCDSSDVNIAIHDDDDDAASVQGVHEEQEGIAFSKARSDGCDPEAGRVHDPDHDDDDDDGGMDMQRARTEPKQAVTAADASNQQVCRPRRPEGNPDRSSPRRFWNAMTSQFKRWVRPSPRSE
eukprot:TRINITY_DN19726_c0_g1_i1.p1 TRINITY_DN19726_c0_g1~~TRINITY_DN19726_c0_g1_i1.p1  ORF type:complete len:935 (+),score=93.17 TRINITY_DN19726_c0_g1_i1:49-2853(+)